MSDNRETAPVAKQESPHSRSRRLPSLIGGLVIGGTLAAMGCVFVYALVGLGYSKAVASDRWIETPCIIEKSQIKTERATPNSPGLSHELEIEYRYDFRGESYRSTRYRRIATRSSHLSKMKDIVDRYPARARAVCYVNPEQPEEAVLKKDTKSVGYTAWFPGLFVIGGVGIALASIRRFFRNR